MIGNGMDSLREWERIKATVDGGLRNTVIRSIEPNSHTIVS